MTWNIHFSGHKMEGHGEEQEKQIADIGRKIVEELKEFGCFTAQFNGNFHQENYLQEPSPPAETA